MKVLKYLKYKDFVHARIKSMPKGGHGEFQKIALHLGMHTTSISQVFRGEKDLNLEQALGLCEYLGLNELETEYFLTLVQLERAGTEKLKNHLRGKLEHLKEDGLQLVHRLPRDQILSDEAKAIFYSSWYFSGIRLLSSIPEYQTIDAIADYFDLPKTTVSRAVEFLTSCGLCIEEGGKIKMGPQRTHLEGYSPFISRHHINWRLKTIERFDKISSKTEIVFSAPMSLSHQDAERVRELLAELAQKVTAIASKSESEVLYCFNMDWAKVQ